MSTRSLLLSFSFALTSFSFTAHASNENLIRETEQLRNSLPSKEMSARQALTLKLANMIFNETIQLSSNSTGADGEEKKINRLRLRAVELYKELLSRNGGKYSALDDAQEAMVEFRLARIYNDLGKADDARNIWAKLYKMDEYPELAGESALSLGEYYEKIDSTAARDKSLECFEVAIKHSKSPDALAYAHYRKGWTLWRMHQVAAATEELKESLFDAKGNVKEEVLRDWIQFSAENPAQLDKQLSYLEQLGEKINRKDLWHQLADSYFAAGNKTVGTAVLARANEKSPNLAMQIRLLEENYGLRQWDAYNSTLEQVSAANFKILKPEEKKTSEEVLRRLLVQLDAERKENPSTLGSFLDTSDVYLKFFPDSDIAFKIAENAYSAETDEKAKITRLHRYTSSADYHFSKNDHAKMNEQMVSLFQKIKNHKGAIAVLDRLIASSEPADRRRFEFVKAAELQDDGQLDPAKNLYKKLALENPKDQFGVKSQLSLVRILGEQKQYGEIVAVNQNWMKSGGTELKNNQEVQTILSIQEKSEFEAAVQNPNTAASLKVFMSNCLANKFTPKSCENVRVVAITTGDHETFASLLKFQHKEDELADHYESIGEFAQAAQLREKLTLASNQRSLTNYLHVALLYEIANDKVNQIRILKDLERFQASKAFTNETEEASIYETLKDAKLLDRNALTLKWGDARRCALTHQVLESGVKDKNLENNLLACKPAPGPIWGKLVMAKVQELYEKQKTISFYGKRSKAKFEQKIASIQKLNKEIDRYFEPADQGTKLELANLGKKTFSEMVDAILKTPIEDGVPEDQKPQIQAALQEMAAPYAERAKSYDKLYADVIAVNQPEKPKTPIAETIAAPASGEQGQMAMATPDLKSLRQEATRAQTLSAIRDSYNQQGNVRVASYFKGRLDQLQGGSAK